MVLSAIGRYRVLGEVARGGMGVVYRAETPEGRQVALKLLLAGRLAVSSQRSRLQREAQALLKLDHPGVVKILDAGEHEGTPFLVLEWVEGQDLGTWIDRERILDPGEAAGLVARLAHALEHCHQRGVLHRDLKPQNVLLRGSDGAPLLTDFGLSVTTDAELEALTRTGQCLGSPGYWPPEQALGQRERIDARSDVWGLGGILYTLLTGRPPLDGSSLVDALAALERGVPPPSRLRPGLPAALDAVCLRCLASDPERRFPSAGAVAGALQDWLNQGAPRGRLAPEARRALGWAASLLLVALGAAAGAWGWSRLGALTAAAPAAPEPPAPALPPAPREDPRLIPLLADAARWRREGKLVEALDACDRALAIDPASARALLARASLRRSRGDVDGAERDLSALLDRDPADEAGLAEHGFLMARVDRWEVAERDAAALAAAGSQDANALTLRALVTGHQDRERGALELVDQALARDPQCVEAVLLRGLLLDRAGQSAEAMVHYERAVTLDPGNPKALARRGTLRHELGRKLEGLADLDQAVELDPLNETFLLNRAVVRSDLDDRRGASSDCDRLLALWPDHVAALCMRGQMRSELGDQAGALEDLTRALGLEPDQPDGLFGLALVRSRLGQMDAARLTLERLLQLRPEHAQAFLLRAEVRDREGDPGARDDYLRLLQLDPNHPRAGQARERAAALAR